MRLLSRIPGPHWLTFGVLTIAGLLCAAQLAPTPLSQELQLVPDLAPYYLVGAHMDDLLEDFPERSAVVASLVASAATAVDLQEFANNSCMQIPERDALTGEGLDGAGPVAVFPIDQHTAGIALSVTDHAAAATFLRSQISAHSLSFSSPDGLVGDIVLDTVQLNNVRFCDPIDRTAIKLSSGTKLSRTTLKLYPSALGAFGVTITCHTVEADGSTGTCTCLVDHQKSCDAATVLQPVALAPQPGTYAQLTNGRLDADAWYRPLEQHRAVVIIRSRRSSDGHESVSDYQSSLLTLETIGASVDSAKAGARFSHDDTFELTRRRLLAQGPQSQLFGVLPGDGLFATQPIPFAARFEGRRATIDALVPLGTHGFAVGSALLRPAPVAPVGSQPAFSSLAGAEVADEALPFYIAYFRSFRPAAFAEAMSSMPKFLRAVAEAVEDNGKIYATGVNFVIGQDGLPGVVVRVDARAAAPGETDAISTLLQLVANKLYQLEKSGTAMAAVKQLSASGKLSCPATTEELRAGLSQGLQQLVEHYLTSDSPSCDGDLDVVAGVRSDPVTPMEAALGDGTADTSGGTTWYLSPLPDENELAVLTARPSNYAVDVEGLREGRYRITAYRVGNTVYVGDRPGLFAVTSNEQKAWRERAAFTSKASIDILPSAAAEQAPLYPSELVDRLGDWPSMGEPYRLMSLTANPDLSIGALRTTVVIEKQPDLSEGNTQ